MTTKGVEGVYVQTHNWGRSAKFFQALGFELTFETDHGSGLLKKGDGAYLFLSEIPQSEAPQIQVVLTVESPDAFRPDPAIEVVTSFEDTHYGTQEMMVRDPDGRIWRLQAPGQDSGRG